ncbi:gliding motility-associated C-terminal domain-containing protein [Parapedobacter sp. DT-150]|uniref:T9SS type B sorting domain-containing protein n=1 Tax=Parapedobacter sp. DT-150 TaxID=3396162 RepID=UPI003F1CDF4D
MTRLTAILPIKHAIAYTLCTLGVLLAVPSLSLAQSGVGSTTADNSTVVIDPETVELRYAETCYFGPNAHWIINGTLEIWSSNIWIAPTAFFSGTGRIIIHDPSENPFYEDTPAGPTRIDGNNGHTFDVTIELRNPNNLILADVGDPGYDIEAPEGPQAAALHLNKRFVFGVDGGDLVLNGHDLYIGEEGSLEDYNRYRMIVTDNNIVGHVVKMYASSRPFTYPVGIAEGDYTPATLSPAHSTTLHVGVKDYAVIATPLPTPAAPHEPGMDRMWHIYSDEPVHTTYTLQHNSITNGSAYVDEQAQIVQHAGSGNWVAGNTQRIAEGIHERDWVAAAAPTANDSWLTKLVSNLVGPEANDDYKAGPSSRRMTVMVLENDRPGSSPIVVNSVRVSVPPRRGEVSVNGDGSIDYTPEWAYVGDDSFVYDILDENGLKDIATVRIVVSQAELIIPNALTPNGDGKNEVFFIQGLDSYDNADLTIFNRWGNEVYRNRNYRQHWDGAGVSDGTYYYRLVLLKGGVETIHKGWVLVKRL